MKIILSTFNYYPEHAGGTEVYTSSLAAHLQQQGHEVIIIAGSHTDPAIEFTELRNDSEARILQYQYNNVQVCTVRLHGQGAEEVYSLNKQGWTEIFVQLLRQLQFDKAGCLVMNGLSTVSGPALQDAFLTCSPTGKSFLMVHTAFVCIKADLINRRSKSQCGDVITPKLCAACTFSAQTKTPFWMGNLFYSIPGIGRATPVTALRLKKLIKKRFEAFASLNSKLTSWVVFSEDMRKFLAKQTFVDPKKIMTIRHGIDTTIFHAGTHQRHHAPLTFVYAGRFESLKGIDILAEAWSQLPENASVRRLVLVGNWQHTDVGQSIAGMLAERTDVEFINGLDQQQLAEMYRSAHCVVIPSRVVETGPLVFHEAIACGCDVISSDIGGQAELAKVYNLRSLVFKSGDATSLANTIQQYHPAVKQHPYKILSVKEHFDLLPLL